MAGGAASLSSGGRDTRNALWGRKPVATILKNPFLVQFAEVATAEIPSRADSMERPSLPGSMVLPAAWRTVLRSIDAVLRHRGTITLSAYD